MFADRDHARLVTTWTALLAYGCTPAHIKAQLEAERWQRCGYAIVLHNGPLSALQRWHVARVHGGPRALITGFTALEAQGLTGWSREHTDVLVPLGTRVRTGSPFPLRLHRVRRWSAVRRLRDARVHVAGQALLVATSSLDQPRSACGLLAATVQQGLLSPARLSTLLEEAPRTRHRALLVAAAADIAQGSEALSEIDFVRICRRFGLPPPTQQLVRRERSGRRRYLDATWRRADGRLVVVEVDGALHLSQRRWWDDQLRQNELALADALVLRFPSAVVRAEPRLVAAQLRRALRL
ncbi:hypothetical protein [Jatrophihabitans sp.]|uniref:hypothetical protein n=1 Tax=Jatrophihabitans sp. TaxID=1932789 RepID=UPI0030C6CE27|nr:hypothetical protein [Jatrophihabitans sp.]